MECLENHGSDHAPGFAPLITIPILRPKAPCRDTIGMTSRISNPHDLIFKHLYSNPQAAAEFLRHNMPKAMAQAIDFSTLTLIKDSFVGKVFAGCAGRLLDAMGLRDVFDDTVSCPD